MRHGRDRLVLCYHTVSTRWPVDFAVTPARFTAQLQSLVERGYRAVTFTAAALGHHDDDKVVAITFDDGYASVAEVARPILDSFGMQATVFLPTDFIGSGPVRWTGGVGEWIGTEHERELRPMTWDQVRALDAAGWEVGSHTKSHPSLTELSDAELEEELTGSRSDCEQMLDRACRSVAFPYGDHDERVLAATERAGYVTAATILAGVAVHSPLRWPRIPVSRFDGARLFRIKTSRTVRSSALLTRVARGMRLFNKRADT